MLHWSSTYRRLAALAGFLLAANAQNITASLTWTNTTSDLSRESREGLASRAAAALFANGVDPSIQTDPTAAASPPYLPSLRYFSSTFSVLALQDYHSGNTTWGDKVVNGMQDYYQQYGIYKNPAINSDSVYWGLAFFYAYRTYKQQALLNLAIEAYNATYTDAFITPDVAAKGSGAGRGVPFTFSNCSAFTYAGGVFWAKDAVNDTEINAETVAPFLALSAYLYEETKEPIYQQAAQLATDFTLNHMWNGTVFEDTLYPATCTKKTDLSLTLGQWFVEGIAVWANVTQNATLTSMLELFVSNVTTSPTWTLNDGVIKEAFARTNIEAIDKGIFVRALTEARARNPGTALAHYIESFITVQFNSILSHSLATDTDFYTTSWFGPANSTFSAAGNIAALDILNAAFSFATPTTSSSSPDSSSTAPTSSSTTAPGKTSSAGAIAGGVVGAVVSVAAIVGIVLRWRRRRRTHSPASALFTRNTDMRGMPATQPFISQSSVEPMSKWERHHAPRRTEAPTWLASDSALSSSPPASSGYQPGTVSGSIEPPDSELPTLVNRLYNLVQGRQGELPPRYEG
ncbi:unnamed protein product [Peniophora sp. CBMAI 1063]|nr:unnamed protein product [Peniophora sp. CBMAI 1063]